jgi:hypothetical protein
LRGDSIGSIASITCSLPQISLTGVRIPIWLIVSQSLRIVDARNLQHLISNVAFFDSGVRAGLDPSTDATCTAAFGG